MLVGCLLIIHHYFSLWLDWCFKIFFFWLLGMDYVDPKRKGNFVGKVFLAAALTALCIIMIKRSPSLNPPSPVILYSLTPLNTQMIIIVNHVYMYMLYFLLYVVFVFYLIYIFINIGMTEWDLKDVAINLIDM